MAGAGERHVVADRVVEGDAAGRAEGAVAGRQSGLRVVQQGDGLVQVLQHLVGCQPRGQQRACLHAQLAHGCRRSQAVPDDVTDYQRGTAVRQREAVHPVAADARAVGGGGLVDTGDLNGLAACPGQQPALQRQHLSVLALVLTGQVDVMGGAGHQFLQVEQLAVVEGAVRPPPDLRHAQHDGRLAVQDQRYARHTCRPVTGHQGTDHSRTAEQPLDRLPVRYDDGLRGIVPPCRLRQQATRVARKIAARSHVTLGPRPVRDQGCPP